MINDLFYQSEIYKINRLLQNSFKIYSESDKISVACSTINYRNRTIKTYRVAPEIWNSGDSSSSIVSEMVNFINKNRESFIDFLTNHFNKYSFSSAVKELLISNKFTFYYLNIGDFMYYFSNIYSKYPVEFHSRGAGIDGIIYNSFQKAVHPTHFTFCLIPNIPYLSWPPVEIQIVYNNKIHDKKYYLDQDTGICETSLKKLLNEKIKKNPCVMPKEYADMYKSEEEADVDYAAILKEDANLHGSEEYADIYISEEESDVDISKEEVDIVQWAENYKTTPVEDTPEKERCWYQDFFSPFFLKIKEFDGTDFITKKSPQSLISHHLGFPCYDARIAGKDFGVPLGLIEMSPFENSTKIDEFLDNNKVLLGQYTNEFSKELIRSGKHDMLSSSFEYEDDLLEQFVRNSVFIQNWERAIIFSYIDNKLDVQSCFVRDRHSSNVEEWVKCKKNAKLEYEQYVTSIEKDIIENKIENMLNKHTSISIGEKKLYIVKLKYIFDSRILPSLPGTGYKDKYKDIILCLEFPLTTLFPKKKKGVKDIITLGHYYFEQLIPPLDELISAEKIIQHGVKSATNSIISRNHSHHIGSHVTPRTSVTLISQRIRKIYERDATIEQLHNIKLRMDNYVQQKADFMAEVATTSLYTTVTKPFYSFVLSRFIQNSLLMDNIGANEGVNFKEIEGEWKNRLRIQLQYNDEPVAVHYKDTSEHDKVTNETIPYNIFDSIVFSCLEKKKNGSSEKEFKDLGIAWPGPLGEFALYCFLENFIRNAIKHNTDKLNKKVGENSIEKLYLDICINISDYDENSPKRDEFYSVEIWDNITDPQNLVKDETLLAMLQKKVNPNRMIIENDGSLKKGEWGIAEMRIMANLLGGSDDFVKMDKLSVSLEEKKEKGKKEKRLVYRFDCMKPKDVLIVADTKELLTLKHYGIYHYEKFSQFDNNRRKSDSIANFSIVVLDKAAGEERKNYELSLPFRVLAEDCDEKGAVRVSKGFIRKILSKSNKPSNIIDCVWKEWGRRFMPEEGWQGHSLSLFLGQFVTESPTQGWERLRENPQETLPALTIATKENGRTEPFTYPIPAEVDKKHIFYDRHLAGCHDVLSAERDICFIEQLEANSADFVPLMSADPSIKLWCKLVESGCLKVLLIDERFAEAAGKTVSAKKVFDSSCPEAHYVYKNSTRLEVARKANIFVATHLKLDEEEAKPVHHSVTELDPGNHIIVELSKGSGNNKQLILNIQGEDDFLPDCMILHQGVAETLLRRFICHEIKRDFKTAFTEFIDEIKKQVPYVLIDSGRGIPSDLPANVKFMSFPLLESFVMQGTISKYSLVEIIMSIVMSIDSVGKT